MAFPALAEILVDGSRMASGSASDDATKATKTDQLPEEQEMEILPVNSIHRDPNVFNHRQELTKLAHELSQSRTSLVRTVTNTVHSSNALIAKKSNDTTIDPSSPDFNIYNWAKAMLRAADEANVKLRQVSFSFKNLNVTGSRPTTSSQVSVLSALLKLFQPGRILPFGKKPTKRILSQFDGVVKSGEMLLVLGCPGSGCSTFLKTMAGELNGLNVDKSSELHYSGISQKEMIDRYKGEIVYNSEVDNHFPYLTVKQTLEFAAAVRTPRNHIVAVSRKENVRQVTAVVMAVCGLLGAQNTRVGDDFVRGVSGGERKRVSIAEMILSSAPVGCWDNSTRGLDAATAFQFVQTLRTSADMFGTTHAVSIYQASQDIYDVFDKVIVLYEGRQIFFGSTSSAKAYFEEMGWHCPKRQTTADFLTSVTSHLNRRPQKSYEGRLPRSTDDFVYYWRASHHYRALKNEIDSHKVEAFRTAADIQFKSSHRATQARHLSSRSRYIVSIPMQLMICTRRAYQRLWNDKVSTLTVVAGQIIMSLIIGSVFYGTPDNTNSFFARGSTLFFAVLLNALIAVTEINNLYQQRPIVEKQASYAFCHPFVEALAGIITDAPVKLAIATCFNLILYFLAGLNPTPSRFFIFFLFTVLVRFTMSVMFRTVAAATKTVSQAQAIAAVLVLALVIYTGYTIPLPYMQPWFGWLRYINPLAFAFEALMVNEFHDQEFPCASFVPSYPDLSNDSFICSAAGAVIGQSTVSGDAYIEANFQYDYASLWPNFGIVFGFWAFFLILYLLATELNTSKSSSPEVLLFRRGHGPKEHTCDNRETIRGFDSNIELTEFGSSNKSVTQISGADSPQGGIFMWQDVVYDIEIKGESRRLLDNVSGWVKPKTLTALMGVSGAGKTTLLNALAQRMSTGVVTGQIMLDGQPLNLDFKRQTGYVQQQDLHLETSTVREALCFSAMLRQPRTVSATDKRQYVEEVIEMLGMEDFSEAVVGVPGEGLNVEQRKLLSIGVELAARPAIVLFLDEPTSGLDSQSSLAIVRLLRKLADHGQAVLATIHQPSSVLFSEFDQLLFLAKGGRTVYFGELGDNSRTVLNYFEKHGTRPCGQSENPAEFILEAVAAGASSKNMLDWPEIWKSSDESRGRRLEQERIRQKMADLTMRSENHDKCTEFAAQFHIQLWYTTIRIFQQYWRTPNYIWAKIMLGGISALFIAFSFFQPNNSLQGLQNVIFSIFMLAAILSSLVQQIIPRFVIQRSLYEVLHVRERPSNTYSWVVFVLANILVEVPYQTVLGIVVFGSYYYPIFGIQSSQRQVLVMLFCIQIFIFASTFAHMIISALPDAQTAGTVATLMFSMTIIFNGVFQPVDALPGFWVFMYRLSPLTYIVGGISATGLHGKPVQCDQDEVLVFDAPSAVTCENYLQAYLTQAPGQLLNPAATSECQYCPLSNSDQFLALSSISWNDRWLNFGIVWAYIGFNIVITLSLYYVFRVKVWKWPKPFCGWSFRFKQT